MNGYRKTCHHPLPFWGLNHFLRKVGLPAAKSGQQMRKRKREIHTLLDFFMKSDE
jgi:hypothetical protein